MVRFSSRTLALAEHTSNAYMAGSYSSWPAVCEMLLKKGYTEREAEAILRSKHLRWADKGVGNLTSGTLRRYIEAGSNGFGPQEVKQLVAETFGE